MACSKIFSGDLPEVAKNIIQRLHNDKRSLHSCVLVNKFLCCLAVPLLWEDPFSIEYRENLTYHFIDTYLLFSNDNDKSKIKEIKFDSNLHKPWFNYPSYIKTLDLFRVQLHVLNWINSTTDSTNSVQQSLSKNSYFPLPSMRRTCEERILIESNVVNEKMQAICITLFKLFIENNVTLNNLHVSLNPSYQNHSFDYAYEMFSNNPTFISNIETFTCHFFNSHPRTSEFNQNIKSFKAFSSSLPSSIKHMDVCIDRQVQCSLVHVFGNIIKNMIQSSSQLSSVRIKFPPFNSTPLLKSLSYSSNTLTSIYFHSYQFTSFLPSVNDNSELDALSSLTQLDSLQFNHWCDLDSNIFQPLLNITTSLKIKTLVISECMIQFDTPIELLIQKISPYLENLALDISNDEIKERFFDAITDFCENIKFLHLNNINITNVSKLSKMIPNLKNLEYLTLGIKFFNDNQYYYNSCHENSDEDLKISSMILKELSKLLPLSFSLYYLDLNLVINPDDLQIFLKNHNQVKRLLIRNWSVEYIDATLNVLKGFIKENNLEFLSYDSIRNQSECHKSLVNFIEETKSLVRMKDYYDLVVKVSDIDGNLVINSLL